jgi:hypothetical protein
MFAPANILDRQAPVRGSSSGKTSGFGPENEGSTPSPRTSFGPGLKAQVRPFSETLSAFAVMRDEFWRSPARRRDRRRRA